MTENARVVTRTGRQRRGTVRRAVRTSDGRDRVLVAWDDRPGTVPTRRRRPARHRRSNPRPVTARRTFLGYFLGLIDASITDPWPTCCICPVGCEGVDVDDGQVACMVECAVCLHGCPKPDDCCKEVPLWPVRVGS